jgi:hypothetical protein
MLKKRKNMDLSFLSDNDDEDREDDDDDNRSFKTPVSERLKLESMSIFYSKSVYPTSLGIRDDE